MPPRQRRLDRIPDSAEIQAVFDACPDGRLVAIHVYPDPGHAVRAARRPARGTWRRRSEPRSSARRPIRSSSGRRSAGTSIPAWRRGCRISSPTTTRCATCKLLDLDLTRLKW